MKAPTEAQIKAEAIKLTKMRPKVRHFTAFGDNNRDAIEAQIAVLDGNLTIDEIEDKKEEGDWSENQRESATYARYWMDGDEPDSPSSGWAPLVGK